MIEMENEPEMVLEILNDSDVDRSGVMNEIESEGPGAVNVVECDRYVILRQTGWDAVDLSVKEQSVVVLLCLGVLKSTQPVVTETDEKMCKDG